MIEQYTRPISTEERAEIEYRRLTVSAAFWPENADDLTRYKTLLERLFRDGAVIVTRVRSTACARMTIDAFTNDFWFFDIGQRKLFFIRGDQIMPVTNAAWPNHDFEYA